MHVINNGRVRASWLNQVKIYFSILQRKGADEVVVTLKTDEALLILKFLQRMKICNKL